MSKAVAKKTERGNGHNGGHNGAGAVTARASRVYRPATDICETETGVVVATDLPGVGPDDVDITLEKGILTIRGRGQAVRPEGYRPVYAEYGEGDFERVFSISEDIDETGINAAVHDGVLMLELPKAEPARPKRIEVKAA